jgi:addiction module HigA family antidote
MRKIRRQPTHPGKIIKKDYLKPLSITITELASILGISRKTLSKIIGQIMQTFESHYKPGMQM